MYSRSRASKNLCGQKICHGSNELSTEPYEPHLLAVKFQKATFYPSNFMWGQSFVLSILYLPIN